MSVKKYIASVRCEKIFPQEMPPRTIGLRLDRIQAVDLAIALLKAVQKDGDIVDVMADKKDPSKKHGYHVTITNPK